MTWRALVCRLLGHRWPPPPYHFRAIYCDRCDKMDFRWNRH